MVSDQPEDHLEAGRLLELCRLTRAGGSDGEMSTAAGTVLQQRGIHYTVGIHIQN